MSGSLHSADYKKFLTDLRGIREAQGTTQVELARRLKVTQAYVSKSERGERRLDLLELFAWLNALDTPPNAFIRDLFATLRKQKSARSAKK